MAKRRKTNISRKKHSQENLESTFMDNVEESVILPSVSELASEQAAVESNHNFDNASFDGTMSGARIDRENIKTDFSTNHFQNNQNSSQGNNLSENKEDPMNTAPQEQINEELTIGAYFKNERVKKGVSLKNISQNTKISHTNLEYLESDNFSKLPNKTYVFGYVKSYAKTLGLDQEYCLDLARQHYNTQKNPVILESHMSQINETQQPMNIKYILFLVLFIGATLTIFLLTRSTEKKAVVEVPVTTPEIKVVTSQTPLKTEALTETTKPTETQETKSEETTIPPVVKATTTEAPVQPKPTTPPPAQVEKKEPVKQEAVVEKKPEPKPEKVKTKKENQAEEKQEFTPISGNLYTVNGSMSQEKINEMIPNRFKNAVIPGYQNVFITASKGNSWLTYKSDDKPIKKFILKEGRNLLIRGQEIRLFLGNINAIDIFLNNKPLKLTSASGVKSLVFPQENGSNYKLPLFIYKKDGTVDTSDNY